MYPNAPTAPWAMMVAVAAAGALLGLGGAAVAQRAMRSGVQLGRIAFTASAIAGAALLPLVVARLGPQPATIAYLVLAVSAIPLSIVDIAEHRLPNRLVIPTAVAVGVLLTVAGCLTSGVGTGVGLLLGATAQFAVYLVLALAAQGQVGMGDVKLGLVAGAATGFLGLHAWLLGLVLGVVLNGVVAATTLLRRRSARGEVPFGPSILAGTLLAVLLLA